MVKKLCVCDDVQSIMHKVSHDIYIYSTYDKKIYKLLWIYYHFNDLCLIIYNETHTYSIEDYPQEIKYMLIENFPSYINNNITGIKLIYLRDIYLLWIKPLTTPDKIS